MTFSPNYRKIWEDMDKNPLIKAAVEVYTDEEKKKTKTDEIMEFFGDAKEEVKEIDYGGFRDFLMPIIRTKNTEFN